MCVPEEGVEVEVAEDDDEVVRGEEERVNGHQPQQVGRGVVQGERVQTCLVLELQTNLCEDFTIMEKALTMVVWFAQILMKAACRPNFMSSYRA